MADLKGNVENQNGHEEILELLPWFLNGTLENEERNRVEHHLQSCSSCQRELEEFEAMQSIVMEEDLELGEIYLEDAMEIIRSKPKAKAEPEPYYPEAKPRKERGFVLRPRLAFSFGVLIIAVLVAGIFIGNELSKTQVLIADDPREGNLASPIDSQQQESVFGESNGVPFLARTPLDQGTFTTYLGDSMESEEDFILSQDENGGYVLDSDIQDARFAGNSGNHRLLLDKDLRADSYMLTGGVVYRANRVDAAIESNHALYTLSKLTGVETRRVELNGLFPVMWDYSVFSQFIVIHRAILNQLAAGNALDEIRFSALTPQGLDINTMRVLSVEEVMLTSSEGEISTRKYTLQVGSESDPFMIELYAQPGNDQLIAVYMPKQPGLGTTKGLFSYRSDLFDQIDEPQS